jgi:hypothetical protein
VTKTEIRDAIEFFNKNPKSNNYNPVGDRSYRYTEDRNPLTGAIRSGIETTIRDPAGILPNRILNTEVYYRDNQIFQNPSPKGGVPLDVNSWEVGQR